MALSPAMVFYSRMLHPGGAVRLLRARLRDRRRTRRHRRGSRVGGDDGRGGRARDGDERDRGDRVAVRRRGRRDCVVVGGAGRPPSALPRQAPARATLVGGRRSGSRGALFVVPDRAWCMVEPFRGAGTYLDRGIDPATRSLGTTTCGCSPTPRPAACAGVRDSSCARRLGAITAWRRSDGSPPGSASGRGTSPATSSLPARFSRRFPTRRPGTCCRSMPAPFRSPASGSRRS